MSAYETGEQKNIPAVLLYISCQDSEGTERILMIHRNAKERPNDFHAGKWNGLGGKCEIGESYRQAASRELFEESNLKIAPNDFRFAGFLQFPNFKPQKSEDWSCMLFTASIETERAASVPSTINEGSLHWIEKTKILSLNLWDGDREFLPLVMSGQPFTGSTWYVDGKVNRSEINPL